MGGVAVLRRKHAVSLKRSKIRTKVTMDDQLDVVHALNSIGAKINDLGRP